MESFNFYLKNETYTLLKIFNAKISPSLITVMYNYYQIRYIYNIIFNPKVKKKIIVVVSNAKCHT